MRKILTLFILIGLVLGFTACGSNDDGTRYTVTFDSAGGSAVQAQRVLEGRTATRPSDPTRTNFDFVEWINLMDNTPWDFDTPITEDISLRAVWLEIFTVTFDLNGGIANPPIEPQLVRDGNTATRPTPDPTREDHNFIQWVNDEDDSLWEFSMPVTANITLKAVWLDVNIVLFEVTFDSDGGTPIDLQRVPEDGRATRPPNPPTKIGDNFLDWVDANDNPWDFDTPITENITLKATWVGGLIVTFSLGYGSPPVTWTEIVQMGNLVAQPNDPERSDYLGVYEFLGWALPGSTTAFIFTTPITANTALIAQWLAPGSTVTFHPNGGVGGPEPMRFAYQQWVGTGSDGGIYMGDAKTDDEIKDEGTLVPSREGYIFRGYATTPNPGGTWIQYTDEWFFRARIVYGTSWWMLFIGAFHFTGPDTYDWPLDYDITLYAIWEEGDEYYDPME